MKYAALEYKKLLRNIDNAALCLVEWANNQQNYAGDHPTEIDWVDVVATEEVLKALKEIGAFLNITIKEV